MRVLICGDRNWSDLQRIVDVLETIQKTAKIDCIIEGGARGADHLGYSAALQLGIPTTRVDADWEHYGRAAGPIRNRQMLDMVPDVVLAFHDHIAESKGTRDCITEARRRHIPVEIYMIVGTVDV